MSFHRPSTSTRRLLPLVADLLADAERASAEGACARALTDAAGGELGTVMAERGRLCWAAAGEAPIRLTSRIAREAGVELARLDAIFAEARELRTPMGELLVSRGILSAAQLRQILLSQVADSLLVLVRVVAEGRGAWSPWRGSPGRSYQPSFTFPAGELLRCLLDGNVEVRMEVPEMPPPFGVALGRAATAVCLTRLAGSEAPLPLAGDSAATLTLGDAAVLARRAHWLLASPALAVAGAAPYACVVTAGNASYLLATSPPHLLAARASDEDEALTLLADLQGRLQPG